MSAGQGSAGRNCSVFASSQRKAPGCAGSIVTKRSAWSSGPAVRGAASTAKKTVTGSQRRSIRSGTRRGRRGLDRGREATRGRGPRSAAGALHCGSPSSDASSAGLPSRPRRERASSLSSRRLALVPFTSGSGRNVGTDDVGRRAGSRRLDPGDRGADPDRRRVARRAHGEEVVADRELGHLDEAVAQARAARREERRRDDIRARADTEPDGAGARDVESVEPRPAPRRGAPRGRAPRRSSSRRSR